MTCWRTSVSKLLVQKYSLKNIKYNSHIQFNTNIYLKYFLYSVKLLSISGNGMYIRIYDAKVCNDETSQRYLQNAVANIYIHTGTVIKVRPT